MEKMQNYIGLVITGLKDKSNEAPVAQNYISAICHTARTYWGKCFAPHRPSIRCLVELPFSVNTKHILMDTNDRFLHFTWS
jgi:hypothetical protein